MKRGTGSRIWCREYSKGLESGSEHCPREDGNQYLVQGLVKGWKQDLLKVLRKDKCKKLVQGHKTEFKHEGHID